LLDLIDIGRRIRPRRRVRRPYRVRLFSFGPALGIFVRNDGSPLAHRRPDRRCSVV